AADVRSVFGRFEGNLGSPGSVKFIFQHKGTIAVKPGPTEDTVMQRAIDAGAEDVVNHGADGFEVRTEPADLHKVADVLDKGGLKLGEQKWTWLPNTMVKIEGEKAKTLLKLLEALEENDDVQNVYANFEMDEKLMEQMSAAS